VDGLVASSRKRNAKGQSEMKKQTFQLLTTAGVRTVIVEMNSTHVKGSFGIFSVTARHEDVADFFLELGQFIKGFDTKEN
jgi:hypothetical protein